jgi:ChpA-C
MRPWASWTAKTALLAAGFAAAGGGLSGVALAGTGGNSTSGHASVLSDDQLIALVSIPATICGTAGALLGIARADCRDTASAILPAAIAPQMGLSGAGSGNVSVGSGNAVSVPVSLPVDICGNAAAVLGDSTAGCVGGALAGPAAHRPAAGAIAGSAIAGSAIGGSAIAGGVIQSAVAPVASALGASGPLRGMAPVSSLAPLSVVTGGGRPANTATIGAGGAPAPGPGSGRTFDGTPGAGAGAGDTNVPAASQLAGLGALPGLADLPSLAGLANMPALNGVTGGGIPMPGTALSAANFPGMSSDSFAALAVGALLAGASALKIAGRRARDRKAGIGVVTI